MRTSKRKRYARWLPQAVPAVHQLDATAEAKSGSETPAVGRSVAV